MISSLFSLAAASLIGDTGLALAGIGIGVGLVVIGAGKSIGNIAGKAVESIARQPEAGDQIKGAAIILSALIEGVCLLGVVVTILIALGVGQ